MSNESYIAMLKFRFLIPLLEAGICKNCGKEGDIYGYHVTKCRGFQNNTHTRHQLLVKALIALLRAANYHPIMDANVTCLGTNHNGKLRPADILAVKIV
jgi:hypothetical protein